MREMRARFDVSNRARTLIPACAADVIVLDRNLLTVDPSSIATTEVLWTFVNGRQAFVHGTISASISTD